MENNPQLTKLISAIKHISLNHQSLIDISLDCYQHYIKKDIEKFNILEPFWNNSFFIEENAVCAREGIVFAMQAITLEENIPFNELVLSCIDIHALRDNEEKISQLDDERKFIKEYFTFLRRELFSKTYSQNKEFQKQSLLPKKILKSRYDFFMNYNF